MNTVHHDATTVIPANNTRIAIAIPFPPQRDPVYVERVTEACRFLLKHAGAFGGAQSGICAWAQHVVASARGRRTG